MQKIEELTEKHDDELVAKERVIASQNKTVELAKEEK